MIRCTKCHWPPCGWLPVSPSAWLHPRRTSPTSQNPASSTAALTSSEPVWWRRISSPSLPVTSSLLLRRARSWDSLCDLWRRSPVMTQTLLEIQKRDWKHKNQLFLSCNIILQTKKLDVAKKIFRAIIFWTWINWTEASGDVAWFTVLGDWRSLLSWAYSRLLIDFLLQKSHFKKVDSIFVENMWIYQNAWFEYL